MSLNELGDLFWRTYLSLNPMTATLLGYRDHDSELPSPTPEAEDQTAAVMAALIEQAEAIDPSTLSADDRITRAVLIDEATKHLVSSTERTVEMNVSPLVGPHSILLRIAAQTGVSGEEQAEAILARYRKIPAYLGVYANRHRQGIEKGRPATQINARHVADQIDAYLSTPTETDPFVNTTVLASWPGEAEWRDDMFALVEDTVRPAFARYRDVIRDEILPSARPDDRPGLTHVDGGDALYRQLIMTFTTLDLSGEEIHQTGLDLVDGLYNEYGEIGESAFGLTDPADVIERLREDANLRFTDEDEILSMAEDAIRRAEGAVDDWFNLRPSAPCVVRPVPADLAPSLPPAYYMPPAEDGSRPGTYFANTHDAGQRCRYESEAIAFHEAVPGHHFDRTIAQELEGVPAFQRYALAFAHAEGWGLYVERLADEMGLYSSDVTRLGMVSADMWRACRLVVDTGIHALGWTRQQAIDFMTEKSAIAPAVIAQEVDRYISMPGQALAYMIGKLQITKLRSRAEVAFGDAFDIKAFHDILLKHGALTLPLMEELVDEWIAAG